MEARKVIVNIFPYTILPIAGPGHSPASPQPIPNITDQMINFLSITPDFFQGKCQVSQIMGLFLLESKKCPGIDTRSAPNITKSNVGSQFPKTSKNHCTRAGEIISERASPNPNSKPATRVIDSEI